MRDSMECQKCGKEVPLPFRCQYCGGYFCAEHRLPENHQCPGIMQARASRRVSRLVVLQKQELDKYQVVHTPLKTEGRIHFSNREIKHLAVAALLVMGIGLSYAIGIELSSQYFWSAIDYVALATIATISLSSFFIHEIAHKIVAEMRGFWAEFRIVFTGALLTLISIFLPFKIISPGAVVISGFADREDRGKISVAGPLTNIILSAILLLVAFPLQSQPFVLGAIFNSWIAVFNLIPFGMLDGFKVFQWNKAVWASTFMASLILTIASLALYS